MSAVRLTKWLVGFLCLAVLAVAVPLALGAANPTGGLPGNAVAGKPLFIADCGKCHTIAAAGSQGSLGPNLDNDNVPFTRVITAITEGLGGIQAEYTISTSCIASHLTAHKCLTFNQLHDIAKFVVTARKGGPGLVPYSPGSP